MPIDKIDNTKYLMPVNHSEQTQQSESNAGAVQQDEEKSNAAKYMIGATALAATIALGVIGHKNNWWKRAAKLGEKNSSKVNNGNSAPSAPISSGTPVQPKPQTPSVQTTPTPHIQDNEAPNILRRSGKRKKKQSKIKEFFSSPLKAIKNRRERIRIEKQQAAEAEARLQAQRQAEYELRQQQEAERRFQDLLDDEPNRLIRIAQKEEKYAEEIKPLLHEDFGEIKVAPADYNCENIAFYSGRIVSPPKQGEYSLKNFAVDGYWNGRHNDVGACLGSYIPGLPINYNNQFTLHDNRDFAYGALSGELDKGLHWAMHKSIAKDRYDSSKIHIGTVLRFSAPKLACELSRPLGWNIFIEGDIPLEKMKEIKKQLVDSGAWARHLVMQDNDSIIEVFNEIIKVLNR